MQAIATIEELRRHIREFRLGCPEGEVGFVPTMGYLHKGHASLVERARQECGLVVLSIFVNPLQFGPNEDFERYPRDPERDLAIAREAGADLVFMPDVKEMYPRPVLTKVTVSAITGVLCGASRPGHFDGVATVVSKLLHIVQPDKAYFGMKDAQQVAVVAAMAEDLNMPVQIVPCPTLREPDGLAMSSRNVYLTPEQRSQAAVLYKALKQAESWIRSGRHTAGELRSMLRAYIESAPLAGIDYADLYEYPSLESVAQDCAPQGRLIVALAVRFGTTRLIDNAIIDTNEPIREEG